MLALRDRGVVKKTRLAQLSILILCTGNSCRSQMAHGFLSHFGKDQVIVRSAGIEVHGLNPIASGVMAEVGIPIHHHSSNHIEEYLNEEFDIVLTVCDHARESCPWFPAKAKMIHHSFEDPAKSSGTATEIIAEFRKVRDQIGAYCQKLISKELAG